MKVIVWMLIFSALQGLSVGASILIVVPTPTRSHHNLLDKLAIELANRGHKITLITAFRQDKPVPNLEEIIYPNYYETMLSSFKGNKNTSLFEMKFSVVASIFSIHAMGLTMTESFLTSPVVKEFLQSNRKYELVIGEAFFVEAVLAGLSRKYSAPLIGLSTSMPSYWVNYMVGNPSPSSYISYPMLGFSERMTYFERVQNFALNLLAESYFSMVYLPKQDVLLKQHFGENLPYIADIMHNTSLVLVNHHYSLTFPRPYLPNMVEIGGYHVLQPKPLPEDLQKYLDGTKNGVILFSMGSHLKSSSMSEEMRNTFLQAFKKLEVDVLWKFEEQLSNLPKNVKIMKWLPQSDILGFFGAEHRSQMDAISSTPSVIEYYYISSKRSNNFRMYLKRYWSIKRLIKILH